MITGERTMTDFIEAQVLLLASEPETEEQARELIKAMPDGGLRYLRRGAGNVVRFVLVEQGNRARARRSQESAVLERSLVTVWGIAPPERQLRAVFKYYDEGDDFDDEEDAL